jgi:FKBP-type peptidyl-prolyl cis-trans isomerase
MRVPVFRGPAILVALVMLIAGLASSACTSPTSPTVGAPFSQTDVKVGTGAAAATGQTLMVTYTGWLFDNTKSDKKGQQFDKSPDGQPFIFKLGGGQVIEGWDLGLVGMKVGGIRRLIVPKELAYGRNGAGAVIPPNATLVFDIELLSVAGTPTGTSGGD